MDRRKTRPASLAAATIVLVMLVPTDMNYIQPSIAQTTETGEDTSSASQDYQEFQACLSDAEVDGYVTEQQIRDCFAPIYNTGTGTASDDSTASSDGDTGGTDDAENENDEEGGGAE